MVGEIRPSYAFFLRNTIGVTMRNVDIRFERPDGRPCVSAYTFFCFFLFFVFGRLILSLFVCLLVCLVFCAHLTLDCLFVWYLFFRIVCISVAPDTGQEKLMNFTRFKHTRRARARQTQIDSVCLVYALSLPQLKHLRKRKCAIRGVPLPTH
jgi:hypothetical protein